CLVTRSVLLSSLALDHHVTRAARYSQLVQLTTGEDLFTQLSSALIRPSAAACLAFERLCRASCNQCSRGAVGQYLEHLSCFAGPDALEHLDSTIGTQSLAAQHHGRQFAVYVFQTVLGFLREGAGQGLVDHGQDQVAELD